MTTYDRGQKKGFTGHPARIYTEMQNYGKNDQTGGDKMTILYKIFSHLNAYLPVHFKKHPELDPALKDEIKPVMEEAKNKLNELSERYNPAFHDMFNEAGATFDGELNVGFRKFLQKCNDTFILLDEAVALSGVIEDIAPAEPEDVG
jgi:hypothetical protein